MTKPNSQPTPAEEARAWKEIVQEARDRAKRAAKRAAKRTGQLRTFQHVSRREVADWLHAMTEPREWPEEAFKAERDALRKLYGDVDPGPWAKHVDEATLAVPWRWARFGNTPRACVLVATDPNAVTLRWVTVGEVWKRYSDAREELLDARTARHKIAERLPCPCVAMVAAYYLRPEKVKPLASSYTLGVGGYGRLPAVVGMEGLTPTGELPEFVYRPPTGATDTLHKQTELKLGMIDSGRVPRVPWLDALAHTPGLAPGGRGGAPLPQALMLEFMARCARAVRENPGHRFLLEFTYRDLRAACGWTKWRPEYLPQLVWALDMLPHLKLAHNRLEHRVCVPWQTPTEDTQLDDVLAVEVRLPPGITSDKGTFVNLHPIRSARPKSRIEWTILWRLFPLWDACGQVRNGNLLRGFRPEVERDADDVPIDADGNQLTVSKKTGKPLQLLKDGAWKRGAKAAPWNDPRCISTGKAERNDMAWRHAPHLTDAELVQLGYGFDTVSPANYRKRLQRVKHALSNLASRGFVCVEAPGAGKTQIVPGPNIKAGG